MKGPLVKHFNANVQINLNIATVKFFKCSMQPIQAKTGLHITSIMLWAYLEISVPRGSIGPGPGFSICPEVGQRRTRQGSPHFAP